MTHKTDVDLETYRKRPRALEGEMVAALLDGVLSPIRQAVLGDPSLRLEIRDRCFNVYYGGGNLVRVIRRKSQWEPHFDRKYYEGNLSTPPDLPAVLGSSVASGVWTAAFPKLKEAMDRWWTHHSRGERCDCQVLAQTNGERSGIPRSDYLVIDMEYQWAQRRFDLVAARRSPSATDATGWQHPVSPLIEVKCELGAVKHPDRGDRAAHVGDFASLVQARKGAAAEDIKKVFTAVVETEAFSGPSFA